MKSLKYHVILALLLSLLLQLKVQAAAASEVQLTFQDLRIADLSLNGLYGAQAIWVPFQSDWLIEQEIKVELVYTASPLLNSARSTLTVLANDQAIASLHPVADGREQRFSFSIPVERLQGPGVMLRFQGYLRLTELTCEESSNPGQWLIVHNQTRLGITPLLNTQPSDLADLPQALVVQNAIEPAPPVLFVLPDNPDGLVLTAAARVAARLGPGVAGSSPMPFEVTTASQLSQTQKQAAHLVVIGLPHNHPLIDQMAESLPAPSMQNGFLTTDHIIAPPEHGLLQIFNSPWNEAHRVLLVSAGQEEGLALAGQALAHQATAHSLHGSFQFVRVLEPALESQPGLAWSGPKTTFVQLGQADRAVAGTGLHQEFYYFRRPPGWVLDNGAQLTLRLSFSPALWASESYVAAFINEVHVGTARPGEGAQEGQFSFELPVALLNQTAQGERPQTLTLRLEVANFLEEANCETSHPEVAWTKISAGSYFVTPHVYLPLPDLQAFPYPFVGDQVAAPTILALPPQPSQHELNAALSLAGALGRLAPTDFSLSLLPASQISPEAQAGAHLIILGTRARQPLAEEFLQAMGPIPGYGEEALYQALHHSETGLLREGPSPWNSERVALLVSGETGAGFDNAVQALVQAAPPVGQSGSVALVETGQFPRVIYRSVEAAPIAEPDQVLRETWLPRPQPWLVVTLVLAITTVAVLALIGFSRRQAARQRGI